MKNLSDSDPDLQRIFFEVIKHYDNSIITGYRDEEAQNEAFHTGRSKVQFPDSKHNSIPSNAVDAAPYPIDWKDKDRFYHFAGFVLGVAKILGIEIRWGGDWDGDTDLHDQTFYDLVHFELITKEKKDA